MEQTLATSVGVWGPAADGPSPSSPGVCAATLSVGFSPCLGLLGFHALKTFSPRQKPFPALWSPAGKPTPSLAASLSRALGDVGARRGEATFRHRDSNPGRAGESRVS